MNDVMFTYMKGFVDQRFGLAHFDSEEILIKPAEVDAVWFLSELDRLLFTHDKPDVCTLRHILNCFSVRCVVHQLEEVLFRFISAICLPHFGVMLDVDG